MAQALCYSGAITMSLFTCAALALALIVLSARALAHEDPSSETRCISAGEYARFDGAPILAIRVHGLTRTSERTVRWLLGSQEGGRFDASEWEQGIRKLYNTQNLYGIRTEIRPITRGLASDPQPIEIDINIQDRWTLLPQVYLQGGGGSTLVGGGVVDTNLGGDLIHGILGVAVLNGNYFYEAGLSKDYFLNTDLMLALDFSRRANPITLQDSAGIANQNFVWARSQLELQLGERIGRHVRLSGSFDLFEDTMVSMDPGTTATVYPFLQYRFRPKLVIGCSNLTDFLEEGGELTFAPSSTDFLDGASAYHQLVMTFKQTAILPRNINLALFTGAGVMTSAPTPYQFRIGGFDTVRGFGANRGIGTAYWNGNFEIRPTLLSGRIPVAGLTALQGCLFTDAGWIEGAQGPLGLLSSGIGGRLIFAQFSNALIRIDLARTISPFEGAGLSFSLGQFF